METQKKVYKVLIRDQFSGIKEDYLELSEEQVRGALDEDGVAYATCYYEDGKPKYAFVPPALWVKWKEVTEILHNSALSPEEQKQALRKLME